jgi:DNA-binding transcriptional LysR family regulator
MVLAPATHRLAKRRSVPLSALADEPLVEFPAGWGLRMVSDGAFAAAGVTRTVTFEVNDTASVIEFVRYGLALSLLPASFVGNRRGVALIPIRGPVPEFRTGIAASSSRRLSAAARTLLEAITARVTG